MKKWKENTEINKTNDFPCFDYLPIYKIKRDADMTNFNFKTYSCKEYMFVRDIYLKSGNQNKDAYNSLFVQFRKHIEDDSYLKIKYDLKYLPWTIDEFHHIYSKTYKNRKIIYKEMNQFFYSLEEKESYLKRINLNEYKRDFIPNNRLRYPNDDLEMSLFKLYKDLFGQLKDYDFITNPLIVVVNDKEYADRNKNEIDDVFDDETSQEEDDECLRKKYCLKKLPWEEHGIYSYMENKSRLEKDIFLEELEDEENESLDED